jgi:hypothetical protein
MARLLSLALLSLSAVLASASAGSPQSIHRMPFCISRGGSDEAAATAATAATATSVEATSSAGTIPSGGASSSYANQLETVKASVLETASESVREVLSVRLRLLVLLCLVDSFPSHTHNHTHTQPPITTLY